MRAGKLVGHSRRVRTPGRGVHRTTLRTSVTSVLLTIPLLATAVPAHAATNVNASGATLRIESGGKPDNLTISAGPTGRLTVTNTADRLVPGLGCESVDGNTVRCDGTDITAILADTGAGDDIVRNDTNLTMTAHLGPGADTFTGGSARDVAMGGGDADILNGGDGPDVLIGGAGRDAADGGPGDDLCITEITTACES